MPISVKNAGGELVNYKLFTPGPIDLPEDVLYATAKPLVYHRDEQFGLLLSEITAALKKILYTNNKILFFTSSGTGAMEAACANILSSNDEPIVAICGKFGERWLDLCNIYKVNTTVLKEDYGKCIKPERLEEVLKKKNKPTVIFTTLTETSTGVLNDIEFFGKISKRYDSFLVVDGIAGIGADFCHQDDWNVDVLIGASQKALMAPPGISFMSISSRALEKTKKSNLPRFYFNLANYEKFLEKGETPYTPAITVLFGMKKALHKILKIGIEKNFKRHTDMGNYVRTQILKMGLEIFPERPSNALSVMKMPAGISSTDMIKKIKNEYKIRFSDGQGELKGKILRIGHMGNYNITKLSKALNILNRILKDWR